MGNGIEGGTRLKDDAAIVAESKPKRIEWIDSVRGFAMFLVIWGHCTGRTGETDLLIYAFHMPLFFAVSGLLFRLGKYPNPGACALDKAKKLLLPYLWMFLINVPLFYLLIAIGGDLSSCSTPLDLFIGFLTGQEFGQLSAPPLWFLPCLFFVSVLYWCLYWLHERKGFNIWISLIVMLLAATVLDSYNTLTVLHIATVPMATFFYGVGHQFMLHKDAVLGVLGYPGQGVHWQARDRARYWIVLATLVAIGVFVAFMNGRISMMGNNYHIMGLAVTHALTLSLATVMLFVALPKIWVIDFVGKNTLFYLGLHMFFLRFFEALPATSAYALGWPFLNAVVVFFLLIPITMAVNRWAPWIVAKKKPRPKHA